MSGSTVSVADLAPRRLSGERMKIVDVRSPGGIRAGSRGRRGPGSAGPVQCRRGGEAAGERRGADLRDMPVGGVRRQGVRIPAEAGVGPAYCVEGGTIASERTGLPVERGSRRVIPAEGRVRVAAGSLVSIGLLLAWLVHPVSLGLSAFVGAGMLFAGLTSCCTCARTRS